MSPELIEQITGFGFEYFPGEVIISLLVMIIIMILSFVIYFIVFLSFLKQAVIYGS